MRKHDLTHINLKGITKGTPESDIHTFMCVRCFTFFAFSLSFFLLFVLIFQTILELYILVLSILQNRFDNVLNNKVCHSVYLYLFLIFSCLCILVHLL